MTALLDTPASELAYRNLVGDKQWNKLVVRLLKDARWDRRYEGWDRHDAELVQNEALMFVHYLACNAVPGATSPSPIVDAGWHNLMLHSRLYRRLCGSLGTGKFIDHDPNDPFVKEVDVDAVPRTVAAMKAAGYRVREELWPRSSECSHSGGDEELNDDQDAEGNGDGSPK